MRAALAQSQSTDQTLASPEDLSCGPVSPDEPDVRVDWWSRWYDRDEVESRLSGFWQQLDSSTDDIVLWFSRHSANELAFFHACVARLASRDLQIVDLGEHRVALQQPQMLLDALAGARRLEEDERQAAIDRWSILTAENAPFRIVSPNGLVSAPLDHFDSWLLSRVGKNPRPVQGLILETMLSGDLPYLQVNDMMLLARLSELAAQGKVIITGDLAEPHAANISLSGSAPQKVLIYATSSRGLLVFSEPDFPDVPLQVPGGTVEPDETIGAAALREFREETGIDISSPMRPLGTHDYSYVRDGETRWLWRSYFHVQLSDDHPETWDHTEASPSDDGGPVLFRFRWMALADAQASLGLGMADFLGRLA